MSDPTNDRSTERDLATALREHPVVMPDLDQLSAYAVRTGTRTRRARQGLAVLATVAVVGVGTVAVSALGNGETTARTVPVASGGSPTVPTASATASDPATSSVTVPPSPFPNPEGPGIYAVLEASGWSTDLAGTGADEKLYYVGPRGASVSLNWRPADTFAGKWDYPGVPADAVIDGDPAKVVENGSTVVGPVKDGRFLTLSGAGLTRAELVALALDVYRR